MSRWIRTTQARGKRLSQSLGLRHFTWAFFRIFFSYVQVYFDCAGSRRTVVPALVCGISFVNCCINDFCVHFDSAGLHKTVLPVLVCGILPANFQIIIMMMIIVIVVIMIVINFFWDEQLLCRSGWNPVTGLCMILHWSLWVNFVKILADILSEVLAWFRIGLYQKIFWQSFCEILSTKCLWEVLAWRSCGRHVLQVLVWKLLWEALGRFLYQALVRSAPAATGPFMTILWPSLRGPGMQVLVKVFTRPCEKILCRS